MSAKTCPRCEDWLRMGLSETCPGCDWIAMSDEDKAIPDHRQRIDLSDMAFANFLGIIVPRKTGIVWSNQTGGHACHHPDMEGFFIPIGGVSILDNTLEGMYFFETAPLYDPAVVQQFLDANKITFLEPLTVEEGNRFGYWGEAWVPVRCKADPASPLLGAYYDKTVILTYPNSD